MDTESILKYIPLDKYWIIRMGVLDMIHGYSDIEYFLDTQTNLGGDLLALKGACKTWVTDSSVDVGESGTLFRFLQFASWKLGLNKQFIKRGTLKNRQVCDDPLIVNWSLNQLLKLDDGTSQWASAAILLGNTDVIQNPPYFISVTFDALEHWKDRRKNNQVWIPRYDNVLLQQAQYFVDRINGKDAIFEPRNPDDYCFARAFGLVSKEYGEKEWPMLRGHESNRLEEMEKAIAVAVSRGVVESKDHRVVQAILMWAKINKKEVEVLYPESVNKSWPKFWTFLEVI